MAYSRPTLNLVRNAWLNLAMEAASNRAGEADNGVTRIPVAESLRRVFAQENLRLAQQIEVEAEALVGEQTAAAEQESDSNGDGGQGGKRKRARRQTVAPKPVAYLPELGAGSAAFLFFPLGSRVQQSAGPLTAATSIAVQSANTIKDGIGAARLGEQLPVLEAAKAKSTRSQLVPRRPVTGQNTAVMTALVHGPRSASLALAVQTCMVVAAPLVPAVAKRMRSSE